MKAAQIIFNWILFIALIAGIWYAYHHWPKLPQMSGAMVVLVALSLAFTWVEVLKWGSVKPFNCMKCMTGWFALALAYFFDTPFWYFYLFIGLFAGAMFSAIRMRWL